MLGMDDTTRARYGLLRRLTALGAVAAKGLPALRAALYGARLGAGARLDAAVVERLGVSVLRSGASALVHDPLGVMVRGRDGLALRFSAATGVGAVAHEATITALRHLSVRSALAGLGRATMQGAAAGAVIDGVAGAVEAGVRAQRGDISVRTAAIYAGKRAARGALSGAAGVAAAGAASAALAATGITIVGAPVVLPIVVMVAAGSVASRRLDKLLGTDRAPEDAAIPVPSLPGRS